MQLSDEQREALDAIPRKQRAFVLSLVRTGDATLAAREAGYKVPAVEGCRLVTRPKVQAALATMREAIDAVAVGAIADAAEIQAFWTSVIRGELEDESANPLGNRVKASELLAKAQGAFVQRVEVDQRTAGVVLHITRDDALRVIEATGEVER